MKENVTPVATSNATQRYIGLSNRLSLGASKESGEAGKGIAIKAKFITPLDPVIETADGNRLPAVPLREAHEINVPKGIAQHCAVQGVSQHDALAIDDQADPEGAHKQDGNLESALPPLQTHPLFPPLPLYGPPTLLRNAQCFLFRATSAFLSTVFLLVIVLGALFTSIVPTLRAILTRLTFRSPARSRPFYEEERRRAQRRKDENNSWYRKHRRSSKGDRSAPRSSAPSPSPMSDFEPLEGGPDRLICDARYYARRVGLEMESFHVQTEDGFIIDLWHVYDPRERGPQSEKSRAEKGQNLSSEPSRMQEKLKYSGKPRYPVLLVHGLLQSAGAYCCNDDDSLAFYLHKSGYDVWLGNNRCGFNPRHTLLKRDDPRMWAWNIRQMGVMDLPAFVSRVLAETGFSKLGLVAHSQGTTQTFVALAKEQVPDLGEKLSIFCALAPAVYAGPLIEKMYFKFMKVISPGMFRLFFGIHAFIPLMMTMHKLLPGKLYGCMGYLVFGFLFNWSDTRWDRGLRHRFFQFAPVYVSAESMRWWLGRECFAKHKCVLSTSEDLFNPGCAVVNNGQERKGEKNSERSWYDARAPPFAIWVAGSDDLVDGRQLLQRFAEGHELHVNVIHSKIIEEYEHLDVLWALDSIKQVGSEVKQIIWETMSEKDKELCRDITYTR